MKGESSWCSEVGERTRFVVIHRVQYALPVVLLGLACSRSTPPSTLPLSPLVRRDIVVTARAAGVVQPDTLVEVKSKASGEILNISVETGQLVRRGAPLVQIDRRSPRNNLNLAKAAYEVTQARRANAESQLRRADALFRDQSISQQERDSSALMAANAKADEITAELTMQNARISLEDTDIRAPITGIILVKSVERGQIISATTADVSGGTSLLKMADLSLVQVRCSVDETDLGKIRPGQSTTVTASSYPHQPLEGTVLKIEPQSVSQNGVTMFPVVVRLENKDGLLLPGMTADVEFHVARRQNVWAIPSASLLAARAVSIVGDSQAFIVFVQRQGVPTPVPVKIGLTDLDYTEVLQGLEPSDSVLVLPSQDPGKLSAELRRRLALLTTSEGSPRKPAQTREGGSGAVPLLARGRP